MDEQERLAARFEEHRATLQALAYRMLGSRSEADDAVQEAWLRLARADAAAIENLGGWLSTVVARISLNMLRARRTRHEDAAPVHLPELVIAPADDRDPEHEALTADSVGLALLVVLETLSPSERLAFVLHDVFAVPFGEIAGMLDSTPAAARQLASRARRRVQEAGPEPDGSLPAQREVVDAFFAAGRDGDFHRLVAVLHPGVVLRTDTGVPGPVTVTGATAVAERARSFADPSRKVLPVTINGAAGAIILVEGRPVAAMAFTVVGGRVAAIDGLADPERLGRIDLAALGA